jgi:hypothetical protein
VHNESVLEPNVSVEVVARYKRASLDRLTTMTALIHKYLPELGENASLFSLQTMAMAGGCRRTAHLRPACRRPTRPSPIWPAST